MKTLSVVIPCYRDAATLGRALLSLRQQTRPADEIILVDDCSPEGEGIRRVLADFPEVSYVRNPANLGLAGSRNEGLRRVSGDWVAFLDADDECHPQRFEFQLAQVGARQAVACDVAHVPADGPAPAETRFGRAPFRVYRSPMEIAYFNRLTGASLLAPTKLLRSFGGYDATLRSCEDFDLWLRLLAGGVSVCRIRLPLYLYRMNPAGLSKNFLNVSRWEAETIRRFADRMGESWSRGPTGISVASTWLLRQLMRCELQPGAELRQQVFHNMDMLASPWLGRTLRLVARVRLLYLPAQMVRFLGAFRSA